MLAYLEEVETTEQKHDSLSQKLHGADKDLV
jgi:hypothetical protein